FLLSSIDLNLDLFPGKTCRFHSAGVVHLLCRVLCRRILICILGFVHSLSRRIPLAQRCLKRLAQRLSLLLTFPCIATICLLCPGCLLRRCIEPCFCRVQRSCRAVCRRNITAPPSRNLLLLQLKL